MDAQGEVNGRWGQEQSETDAQSEKTNGGNVKPRHQAGWSVIFFLFLSSQYKELWLQLWLTHSTCPTSVSDADIL